MVKDCIDNNETKLNCVCSILQHKKYFSHNFCFFFWLVKKIKKWKSSWKRQKPQILIQYSLLFFFSFLFSYQTNKIVSFVAKMNSPVAAMLQSSHISILSLINGMCFALSLKSKKERNRSKQSITSKYHININLSTYQINKETNSSSVW